MQDAGGLVGGAGGSQAGGWRLSWTLAGRDQAHVLELALDEREHVLDEREHVPEVAETGIAN
jgi:hypothetical protein